jgi:hypothetical protein
MTPVMLIADMLYAREGSGVYICIPARHMGVSLDILDLRDI